jgi:hypothetical protein
MEPAGIEPAKDVGRLGHLYRADLTENAPIGAPVDETQSNGCRLTMSSVHSAGTSVAEINWGLYRQSMCRTRIPTSSRICWPAPLAFSRSPETVIWSS